MKPEVAEILKKIADKPEGKVCKHDLMLDIIQEMVPEEEVEKNQNLVRSIVEANDEEIRDILKNGAVNIFDKLAQGRNFKDFTKARVEHGMNYSFIELEDGEVCFIPEYYEDSTEHVVATGMDMDHQFGGVMCKHVNFISYLIPLIVEPKASSKWFYPETWYKNPPNLEKEGGEIRNELTKEVEDRCGVTVETAEVGWDEAFLPATLYFNEVGIYGYIIWNNCD